MKDYLHDAVQELKRADHLMYVSLKYTRTVDVFRSIIERLIESLRISIDGLLERSRREGKIQDIPQSPKLKTEEVQRLYNEDETVNEMVGFYLMLRRLLKAPYTRSNEFRRHVTMTSSLPNGEVIETTIDSIEEQYKKAKEEISILGERYGE